MGKIVNRRIYVITYIIGSSVFFDYASEKPDEDEIIEGVVERLREVGVPTSVKVVVRRVDLVIDYDG